MDPKEPTAYERAMEARDSFVGQAAPCRELDGPPLESPRPVARKDDGGKLDMTLLDDMPRALAAVVEVMQWAIKHKQPVPYTRGSWLGVHPNRYRAAIMRHNADACKAASEGGAQFGDNVRFMRDDETKLLHLAHQACSALMALENTLREMETK